MEKNIFTYNLCEESSNSDKYYEVTKKLAVVLGDRISCELKPFLDSYRDFICRDNREVPREHAEYGLELLLLAVLHKENRSYLSEDFPHYTSLYNTFTYLKDSGEFEEEVIRFKNWMTYFLEPGMDEWKKMWAAVCGITEWIEEMGECYLRQYLTNVGKFRETIPTKRNDYALLSQSNACYYINMVGAQLLNQVYAGAFQKAEVIYIFLPGCMTLRGVDCQAVNAGDGYECKNCNLLCGVNRLSKQYNKGNKKVRILYHESEMNQKGINDLGNIGVIGVACVLTLLSGGFKARRLGYVPQCVILDHCGCSQHWGMGMNTVTSLNEREISRVLGDKMDT